MTKSIAEDYLRYQLYRPGWIAYTEIIGRPYPLNTMRQMLVGEKFKNDAVFVLATDVSQETIIMARFIRQLSYENKILYLCVDNSMYFLFQHIFSHLRNVRVLTLEQFDLIQHNKIAGGIHILELPRHLGLNDAGNGKIKNSTSYIGGWRKPENEKITVGLGWSDDIPMDVFHEIVERFPELKFVSLETNVPGFQTHGGLEMPIKSASTTYHVYRELQKLDFVISVDSPVLHIAASMGAPSLAVLKKEDFWTWHTDAHTPDWYPAVDLVRYDNKCSDRWEFLKINLRQGIIKHLMKNDNANDELPF